MHISLSEILVILLVALLVIKPEHLPDAIITVSRWIKWLRITLAKIKREIAEPLEKLTAHQSIAQPVDHERK